MNALKRKMDEGTSETKDGIAKTQDSISQMKKEFQVQLADAQKETQKEMQKEMQALKQELQGQLAEIMQILRSRPSA